MFGYTAAELVGANVSLLMSAALGDEHDRHLDQFRDRGHSHVIGVSREVAARRKDGSEFPIRLAVGQVQDVQERRFVGFISDITEIKRAQVEGEHEATHDALTGLPNRRAFYAILEAALPRADRQGSSLVLMFIDLDGFKAINDGMGHAAGDELLKGVAQRMKEAVRRSDTVARLGGDEFVLLAESVGQAEAGGAELLAEKVLEAVAEPVAGPRGLMQVGASIGVACRMPGSGLGADALVSLADQAMYAAKRAGKHRVVRVQNRRPQDLPAKMPVF
jgi:diguanylate cyclase (GGDEF)-like protein/PAS domain S-box-containing protein